MTQADDYEYWHKEWYKEGFAEGFKCGHQMAKKQTIENTLGIIDEMEHDTEHVAIIGGDNKFAGVLCNSSEFRDRVLALKGSEQK